MLSDILTNLTSLKESVMASKIQLILLFAPAQGRSFMETLLDNLGVSSDWILLPMITGDLKSSDLGTKLTDALVRAKLEQQSAGLQGPVIFLGMDSPETPLDEIEAVFTNESSLSSALLCPAEDGGYGMLSVPPSVVPEKVFAGVRWSQSLTAVSQLKALSDAGIFARIGRLMYDIDEPEDVLALASRLHNQKVVPATPSENNNDVLLLSSVSPGRKRNSECPRTQQVLKDFGFLTNE
mmetsp:Transcript_3547/g.6770  ORF Transcript_3547/g.6770 Transcript_3547/m.6770 type:complete len:238 (+) Transcript_3547:1-714(+)